MSTHRSWKRAAKDAMLDYKLGIVVYGCVVFGFITNAVNAQKETIADRMLNVSGALSEPTLSILCSCTLGSNELASFTHVHRAHNSS